MFFRLYTRGVDDEEKGYGVNRHYCDTKRFSSNRQRPVQNTNLHDSRDQDDVDRQFLLKLEKYVELSRSKTQFKTYSLDNLYPIRYIWRSRMIVNQTPEFQKWMQKLRDIRAKAHVLSRLTQVEGGNLGDFKSVGNGVLEMRINYGPGYRLYFAKDGETIVILLIGGDKSSQDQDIVKAKNIWQGIKNEKK